MATRERRGDRRDDALSRERIVDAAITLLDAEGEAALTFRALTEHLATGAGAIYWHVANKGELLDAATDALVAVVLDVPAKKSAPKTEVRALAFRLFDALAAHPWLAAQVTAQLSRAPWGPVAPRIIEGFGRQVAALGVPLHDQFNATFALVHYVLGAAAQNAANHETARALSTAKERKAFFDEAMKTWQALDATLYPFTRSITAQLREHDDRAQFIAGVDLILAGIASVHG